MKIIVATTKGEVIETIDLSDADLQKVFAQAWVMDQIIDAVNRARMFEEQEKNGEKGA